MKPAVICFSGKRKCGKDFVASLVAKKLHELGYRVVICGVSHPLKEEYAQQNNIDAKRLKYDLTYKEKYRQSMIEWSEGIRNKDPGYFCRKVLAKANSVDVLIVPDCRRLSDIDFFKRHCGSRLRLVRIETSLLIREMRGFEFMKGVDDQTTECGLDDFSEWDIVISNDVQAVNGTVPDSLKQSLFNICLEVQALLSG